MDLQQKANAKQCPLCRVFRGVIYGHHLFWLYYRLRLFSRPSSFRIAEGQDRHQHDYNGPMEFEECKGVSGLMPNTTGHGRP